MTEVLAQLALIFRDNLLPIFLLIGVGWWLERRFSLDMRTLSKINIYVFVPALALDKLTHAELPAAELAQVAGFVLGLQTLLYLAARGWSRLRGYSPELAAAFCCSAMFYNSGNYGLPLIALLFGLDSVAVGMQTIVLAVQNGTTWSVGAMVVAGPRQGVRQALLDYFRMPFPYALGLGLVLGQTGWRLPEPVDVTVGMAADALVPVALVTLGAQLGRVRLDRRLRSLAAAVVMRLAGGPLAALGLLWLLGWQGLLAQVLLISSAVPTAVNTTLLAIEFDNEPEFAAQAVMASTLLSGASVALVILLARAVFPLG